MSILLAVLDSLMTAVLLVSLLVGTVIAGLLALTIHPRDRKDHTSS